MATFSYSGDPSSSLKDETRFWLQDAAAPWLVSDEEINFALTRSGQSALMAASDLAGALAARFSRRGTVMVDGLSINYSERAASMRELSAMLKQQAVDSGQYGALPFAGGVSRAVDDELRSDADGYNGTLFKIDPRYCS